MNSLAPSRLAAFRTSRSSPKKCRPLPRYAGSVIRTPAGNGFSSFASSANPSPPILRRDSITLARRTGSLLGPRKVEQGGEPILRDWPCIRDHLECFEQPVDVVPVACFAIARPNGETSRGQMNHGRRLSGKRNCWRDEFAGLPGFIVDPGFLENLVVSV